MLDFLWIGDSLKKDGIYIKPKFKINYNTEDLMIQGGDFYAVWDAEKGLWSKSEQSVIDQVDAELDKYAKTKYPGADCHILYMKDSDSGSIDRWHKFVQRQMRDHFKPLDETIVFANTELKKELFASKKLAYAIGEGDISAYDELMGTLYDDDERAKLEWSIGAIISGDAKRIQKFIVLYGSAGSGKSTFLNIVQQLFKDYYSIFNAKELASDKGSFPLESFKSNPLVSIQHDGDLSKIEDNTTLNSIVSHEFLQLNAKYTKIYTTKFNTFLYMGTNRPVKITEAKSGIIRRLIDVRPSGRKVAYSRYKQLMAQIEFELGAIAYHCLKVYEGMGEDYYENYIPIDMIAATNDFYDFVEHYIEQFERDNMVTLTAAWALYDDYCKFANAYKMPYRVFRTELHNYFKDYAERTTIDGKRVYNVYSNFISEKFDRDFRRKSAKSLEKQEDSWLIFNCENSLFDRFLADCPAQYAKENGSPKDFWVNVHTTMRDIDSRKLHWVKTPGNLVTVDFDIHGEDGNKDFEANKRAASLWPKTYAELSKSEAGIHLEYLYLGNTDDLEKIYNGNKEIEIKVCKGDGALRRRVTKCNDIPIATLAIGALPVKGEQKKVVNWEGIKNEKMLISMIGKCLAKKYHQDTTSNVDYIKHLLDEAYEKGIPYSIPKDMQDDILAFALSSTNQKARNVNTVGMMKFEADPEIVMLKGEVNTAVDDRIVIFDTEIYMPDEETDNEGLFLICWKYLGEGTVTPMVNPKPWEVEALFRYKLVGYNNLAYDNPMLEARAKGADNRQLYELSQSLINNQVRPSYTSKSISYTDVLDFCTEKMSLKKWEIRLHMSHMEMGIPWDKPAPKDMWPKIIEYCSNDVLATEAVFVEREEDFMAREFQVALCKALHGDSIKVSVNDTTNTLSKRIIFGNNKEPQGEFNYRNLAEPVGSDQYEVYVEKFGEDYPFRVFDENGLPQFRAYIPGEVLPDGWSILPFFPGYECKKNEKGIIKSTYLGESVGEGGRVFSRRGFYMYVWDGDVTSMHPYSAIMEVLFGKRFTKIFREIVEARAAIKRKDFDKARKLLGGVLIPFLEDESKAKGLAQALKIVINSIYGLTKAGFKNEFRDARNFDNIVAKRGALFMTLLKQEVERNGYLVCHIKTDSIKIPNADDKIKDFVIRFGKEFGYNFETEAEFTKFCIVNDAAYVGRETDGTWNTKASMFKKEKSPYVFKTLFSHEPIEFYDLCETKSTTEGALYLDYNEDLGEPVDDLFDKEVARLHRMTLKKEKELKEQKPGITDNWITRYIEEDPEIQRQNDICLKLQEEMPKHHNYTFIGRVGLFSPVKEGVGGGVLYQQSKDGSSYNAASGTVGYRWRESEWLKQYGREDWIDISYYEKMAESAKAAISKYVDFDWFVSDDMVRPDFVNIPEGSPEEIPF